MSFVGILIATGIIGVVGLLIGLFLGIAGIKFKVDVDEREEAVLAALPGNNCGGCGYPGCSGLAAAITKGEAPVNACPVGGEPVGKKIGEIMGVSVGESRRMVAFVHCQGDCDKTKVDSNTQAHRTVICFPLYRTEVRRPVTMAVSVTEAVSRLVRLMRSMW